MSSKYVQSILFGIFYFPILVFLGEFSYNNYKIKYIVEINIPIISGMYVKSFGNKSDIEKLVNSNDNINLLEHDELRDYYKEKIFFPFENFKGEYNSNMSFHETGKKDYTNYYTTKKTFIIEAAKKTSIKEIAEYFNPYIKLHKKYFLESMNVYKNCLSIKFFQTYPNIKPIYPYVKVVDKVNPNECIIYTKRWWQDKNICDEKDVKTFSLLTKNRYNKCSQNAKIEKIQILSGNISFFKRIIYYTILSSVMIFLTQCILFNREKNEK